MTGVVSLPGQTLKPRIWLSQLDLGSGTGAVKGSRGATATTRPRIGYMVCRGMTTWLDGCTR